ncbi:MAG: DUF3054 domain-containing protein [bacterium]|nr:DUF3054 domain-containing protein [bacterium]MCP4968799.1 DUF3054 domain-containing protein [bacterium]
MPYFTESQRRAIVGDIVVLVALTVVGFATHLTLDAFGRMAVTLVASLLAWGAVAPFLDVYSPAVIDEPRAIWRVGWAWLLAAPLATFLRGAILGRDIPPVFVVVTILVNGFGLVLWRVALGWSLARRYRVGSSSTSSPR